MLTRHLLKHFLQMKEGRSYFDYQMKSNEELVSSSTLLVVQNISFFFNPHLSVIPSHPQKSGILVSVIPSNHSVIPL